MLKGESNRVLSAIEYRTFSCIYPSYYTTKIARMDKKLRAIRTDEFVRLFMIL